MIDVEKTIISQYGNSSTIGALISNMNAYLDPRADFDNFFSFIWDVSQAQGFGLDIWGRVVDVDRLIVAGLDDDSYRQLIYLKALSNISSTTVPAISQLLRNWVGTQGRAYINDLGGMRIRYTFEFLLTDIQKAIFQNSDIFLRPAGVGGFVLNLDFPVFGFSEMGNEWITGFNQAAFGD